MNVFWAGALVGGGVGLLIAAVSSVITRRHTKRAMGQLMRLFRWPR